MPGAVGWNWTSQLSDQVRRDIIPKDAVREADGGAGIGNDTTVILYGDNNNWFAAYAFWLLKIYGHQDVRLMNGGRKKWLFEGRELTKEAPKSRPRATARPAPISRSARSSPRPWRPRRTGPGVVDVRRPAEFSRQDPGASRPDRDLPARRPHPRRRQHPLGPGRTTTAPSSPPTN